jgi:hypothetical protein
MTGRSVGLLIAAWVVIAAVPRAEDALSVGLVPFDIAAVEGATLNASSALAKLVRLEMLKAKGLQPALLDLPVGTQLPLTPKKAAQLGRTAETDIVLVGTILEATSSHSNHGASTGRFGGYPNRASASSTSRPRLCVTSGRASSRATAASASCSGRSASSRRKGRHRPSSRTFPATWRCRHWAAPSSSRLTTSATRRFDWSTAIPGRRGDRVTVRFLRTSYSPFAAAPWRLSIGWC